MPYLLPIAISMIVVLAYVMIRFLEKLGVWKTLALYVLTAAASELLYLSIFSNLQNSN